MQASIVLLASVASVAAVAACAEQARSPVPPRPPLGMTHVAPSGTMPPDTQPPTVALPAPIHELGDAARELSSHEGTRSHGEIIEALRALAEAGALLAPDRIVEIDAIRRAGYELGRSRPESLQHADYTRYGLDAALRLFAAASPRHPMQIEEYMDVLQELKRDVEAIDPNTPLLAQHHAVARAFRTAARAMYVAYGAVPVRAPEEARAP